jgi:hypothetical protein
MRYALAFCCLFIAAPADADSQLLVDIRQRGYDADNVCTSCYPGWVGMKFSAAPDPLIDGPFYVTDVGRVITATQLQIDRMRYYLRGPGVDAARVISAAVDDFAIEYPDHFLWTMPDTEWTTVTTHVPRRGPALIGYQIDGATVTIDQAEYGNGYSAAGFTVRLYGEQVPEPASWLLACRALCCVRRHR